MVDLTKYNNPHEEHEEAGVKVISKEHNLGDTKLERTRVECNECGHKFWITRKVEE